MFVASVETTGNEKPEHRPPSDKGLMMRLQSGHRGLTNSQPTDGSCSCGSAESLRVLFHLDSSADLHFFFFYFWV